MRTSLLAYSLIFVLSCPIYGQSNFSGLADKLQAETIKLFQQGKYNEALVTAKGAVAAREKEVSKKDPKLAIAFRNLAAVYVRLGNDEEAGIYYEKALRVYEGIFPQDTESIIRVLTKLAECSEGNLDPKPSIRSLKMAQAIEFYQRALTLADTHFGRQHFETGLIWTGLASSLFHKKQHKEAEDAFQRAIDILEKSLGPNDPKLAEPLEGTACLMTVTKRETEAERLRERVNQLLGQASADKNAPLFFPFKTFNCRATKPVVPSYPAEAKAQLVGGRVIVKVIVDETGRVITAASTFPNRALAKITEEAALKWQFKPAVMNGVPRKMEGYLTFHFSLQ